MDIQFIIAIATLAVSAGIAWGISQSKQKALEIRLAIIENEHKNDHDLIIRIDEKVNIIIQKIEKLESRLYC